MPDTVSQFVQTSSGQYGGVTGYYIEVANSAKARATSTATAGRSFKAQPIYFFLLGGYLPGEFGAFRVGSRVPT